MTKPRIKLPDVIKAGDIIEVKALISHGMETGQRRNAEGRLVARNIIHTFSATFNDVPVFTAELQPGISANPYISFHLRVTAPGDLELVWTDDTGLVTRERQSIVVA